MPTTLHLSIPVRDLETSRRFYVDTLGCRPGRVRPAWIDVWFWGMQLTLQQRPDEVRTVAEQGVRHFGVAMPAAELRIVVERLGGADDVEWVTPLITATDPALNGKTAVKIADPSGNVIELKSYDDELPGLADR